MKLSSSRRKTGSGVNRSPLVPTAWLNCRFDCPRSRGLEWDSGGDDGVTNNAETAGRSISNQLDSPLHVKKTGPINVSIYLQIMGITRPKLETDLNTPPMILVSQRGGTSSVIAAADLGVLFPESPQRYVLNNWGCTSHELLEIANYRVITLVGSLKCWDGL